MKHRLFALFLALILAVSALTACSNTPEESKGSSEEATLPESSSETEEPTTEEPTTEEPTTEEPSTEPPVITSVSVISDPQKTEYTFGE